MEVYIFTEEQLRKLLAETINMHLDYQPRYGWSINAVVQEVIEGLDASEELVAHGELDRTKAGMILLPDETLDIIKSATRPPLTAPPDLG